MNGIVCIICSIAELIFGDSLPLKSRVYLFFLILVILDSLKSGVYLVLILDFVKVVIQVSQQITTAVPHTIDVSLIR